MIGPAATLREAHRLRRHAKDLQSEIERVPFRLKAQQTKIAKQEESLRQGQDALKKLKVKLHDKEVTLKTAEQQIAKYEQQRNQATSKKEYDAFQAEIGSTKKQIQKIEDDILEVMGEVEEKTAQLPELDKAVKLAKEELVQFEKTSQARAAGLAEQLQQAQKELTEVETSLAADVRTHYQRLVSARGEDALSAVQGRTCQACYTEITAQSYNELMQGLFVPCKSCGRILYLPE
jgi:predicted  nucleic acid-binding Zn-ribbon protein